MSVHVTIFHLERLHTNQKLISIRKAIQISRYIVGGGCVIEVTRNACFFLCKVGKCVLGRPEGDSKH
jgi:hypothetical protein